MPEEELFFFFNPSLPGPDLACRALFAQTLLLKYYSDKSVFQASRARAGQYSIAPILQLGRSPSVLVPCLSEP